MQVLLHVQAEKIPFVLELLQQLDGVDIVRMENNELAQRIQPFQSPPVTTTTAPDKLGQDVHEIQGEIDDLFGMR